MGLITSRSVRQSNPVKIEVESFDGCSIIPEDLLLEILSFVPANDLVKNCNLVCKHWKELIDSHALWKVKCKRDKKFIPNIQLEELPRNYYKRIYFFNPYARNFIKNPCGNDGLSFWKFVSNGGDGFCVEDPPNGCDSIPESVLSQSCFATSYDKCTKIQRIDLLQEGVHKEILDSNCGNICISEWFAARFDCGSSYELRVLLLDDENREVGIFHFAHNTEQWIGREWTQISHTFEKTQGVRFVYFEHSGQDSQFWAGHYGGKMTGATVKFCFE